MSEQAGGAAPTASKRKEATVAFISLGVCFGKERSSKEISSTVTGTIATFIKFCFIISLYCMGLYFSIINSSFIPLICTGIIIFLIFLSRKIDPYSKKIKIVLTILYFLLAIPIIMIYLTINESGYEIFSRKGEKYVILTIYDEKYLIAKYTENENSNVINTENYEFIDIRNVENIKYENSKTFEIKK